MASHSHPRRPTHIAFDEQLWPVNAMLAVLAAFAAGVIATHSDFDTPRLPANGWFQLGTLAAMIVVLAWTAVWLEGRIQRRMQLAVGFSLLVHLWLCVVGYHFYLGSLADQEIDTPDAFDEPRLVMLPDYHWPENRDEVLVDEPLETPVETETPDAEMSPLAQAETDLRPADRPVDEEPAVEVREPSPTELARAEVSAPHRSEQLSGVEISRNEMLSPVSREQVLAPTLVAEEAESKPFQAQMEALQRQSSSAPIERRTLDEQVPNPTLAAAAMNRREGDNEPSRETVPARIERQLASAPDIHRVDVDALQPAAPAEPTAHLAPATDQARGQSPRRTATRKPDAAVRDSQSSEVAIASAVERRVSAEARPTVLAVESARRAAREISSPPTAARAEPVAGSMAAAYAKQSEMAPLSTGLTRANGGVAGLTRQRQYDVELPASAPSARSAVAARRSQSTQEFDASDSSAPSQTALVPRARVGTEMPSAAQTAQDVTLADTAGSQRPGDVEASSSAAQRRAASTAPRGRLTAAAGTAAVDLGPPQLSSTIGQGRTAGGGEPTVAVGGSTLGRRIKEATGGESAESYVPGGGDAATNFRPAGETAALADPKPAMPGRRTSNGIAPRASAGSSTTGTAVAMLGEGVEVAAELDAANRAGAPAADAAGDVTAGSGSGVPRARLSTGQPGASAAEPIESVGMPAGLGLAGTAEAGSGDLFSDAGAADSPGGSGGLAVARRTSGGWPVRIQATVGPGGLDNEPALDVGLPSRRARPESEVVHTAVGRMIVERSGGKQAAEVRVRDVAVPGLKQRDRETRQELARRRGGNEGSERAVEMGLDFLARHQNADGSWSLHAFGRGKPGYENAGQGRMQSDTAATGLSLLAFLGAGYTHTDGKYRLVVGRGLSYLVDHQRADGDLYVPQDEQSNKNVWLYSHGIAAIALGEAFGMTRDSQLRDPAQWALGFIATAQNPIDGGWRYSPRVGSDTSVSGWQLMALKSGELAGLDVPRETYELVGRWLDGAQSRAETGLYAYRPKSLYAHQHNPSRVMTAEALLMRQYLGWKRDNSTMLAGAEYLQKNLPQWTAGARDTYYWYYATQVMFQMGGARWHEWNERLRPLLVEHQVAEGPLAGSWDPLGSAPDRWGSEAGRIYVTAMHLLVLEVYYRHLPLYQNLEE